MSQRGARTADYDFELPDALIAQAPAERRDASRLMVVDRAAGTITHRQFADLADLRREVEGLADVAPAARPDRSRGGA